MDMQRSISKRIRGRALQQIREAHFRYYPLCVLCQAKGRVSAATQLDHILALVNGGKDETDNRQGLCNECHRDKTAEDLGNRVRHQVGTDGWPQHG